MREDENRTNRGVENRGKIFAQDEMYFSRDGDKVDGPFCTQCHDADGKLIRLQQADFNQPRCPKCGLSQGPKKVKDGPTVVRSRVVPLSQQVKDFYDSM